MAWQWLEQSKYDEPSELINGHFIRSLGLLERTNPLNVIYDCFTHLCNRVSVYALHRTFSPSISPGNQHKSIYDLNHGRGRDVWCCLILTCCVIRHSRPRADLKQLIGWKVQLVVPFTWFVSEFASVFIYSNVAVDKQVVTLNTI